MSNSGEESEETTGSDSTPERGYISDEQLPEDLQPKKNPLARDPDDDERGRRGRCRAGQEGRGHAGHGRAGPDLRGPVSSQSTDRQPSRRLISSLIAGTTSCRSPMTAYVALVTIGASASELIARMVFADEQPAQCWIAPLMPHGT